MVLVCHVILQDHVIKRSCDLIGKSHQVKLPTCQVWWGWWFIQCLKITLRWRLILQTSVEFYMIFFPKWNFVGSLFEIVERKWYTCYGWTFNVWNNKLATSQNSIQRFPKALDWRCSVKTVFLTFLQNSQEHTCAGVNEVACQEPVTLLKRDFSTDVFLWICVIFKNTFSMKHLLGCFWFLEVL